MEEIRSGLLYGITTLAINDPYFRQAVMQDLEGTLTSYGFAPNDQEWQEIRKLQRPLVDMSDEQILHQINQVYDPASLEEKPADRPNMQGIAERR